MIGVFDRPDGGRISRRELLCAGALGAAGLSLPRLLASEARGGRPVKSAILIFAWGGPAQHETFDMKPDAPAEIRGAFNPIQTSVVGTHISEYLPRLSRQAHRFAIIRSACHSARIHNPGASYALTGRAPSANIVDFPARRTDFPSLGSIAAQLMPVTQPVPPYVIAPVFANDVNIPTPGQIGGFFGARVDPMVIAGDPSARDFNVAALQPRGELDAARLEGRRGLADQVNRNAPIRQSSAVQGLDRHVERAFDLVSSTAARRAFDLTQEPDALRQRYGMNRHGQSVLLARRLVEAGTRLVMVNHAEVSGQNKLWDTHGDGFRTLRQELPYTDAAVSTLLDDLADRGMLDSTLVVWMGEFGRSPRVDTGGGRDHWPDVYSLLMAGAGVRGGLVHGSSDRIGGFPRDGAVSPEEIHATMYHALGIPEDTHIHDSFGRPIGLYPGRPIRTMF